ncbi:MAG TPA: hypothetical protein VGB82_07170 [Alphaproteobacteria bacterium]
MTNWSVLRSCGMIVATALVATLPAGAWAQEHGNSAPPPVDTQTNPDAVLLNARNPLAVHAGPGKPNVGSIYMPPTLSGKDKGKNAKAGQTESKVMGAEPTH